MSSIAKILLFLSFACNAFASGMSYQCKPAGQSSLDAGPTDGTISRITKLTFPTPQTPSDFKVVLDVEGKAYGDTQDTAYQLTYSLKEMKDSMMLELKSDDDNAFDFNAVFLQLGNIDVITAGPIPPGTYKAVLSMAFIDSNLFYQNKYPMKVAKVDFNCLVTFE